MTDHDRRQNAIWIFTDQHRAQALGCNGDPNLHTPNLDRMATNGVNVQGAVSGFPLCCPFRGSLLASKYPHKCVPGHEYRMDPETPTVADAFKEHGYHTAYFGKWHLDGWHERDGRGGLHIVPPDARGGFDEWVGYENNNDQWDCWVHGGAGEDAFQHRLPGYETDCLTDMLVRYIDRRAEAADSGEEQPFFAVMSVQPPHNPYVAPEEWMRRHTPGQVQLRQNVPPVDWVRERARRNLAGYYAMIENMDWNVGRVMEALEDTGLIHDTHVIFFSDHGDLHGSHGQFHKTAPWAESIDIPCILGGLGTRYGVGTGRRGVPMNHVDFAPTTLGLCGIDAPDWMEGTDYSGLRRHDRDTDGWPDSAYLQSVIPTGHGNSVDRPWRGIVTEDGWKYVCLEGHPWLMFDLDKDPYELVNMAHNTAFRNQRKRLHERLRQWIADTGDEFDLPEV